MTQLDRTSRLSAKGEGVREVWRTDAQTDIDRIWYASEFRRLEGVTQVVPPQNEYIFHDRLTHSVKVAQVASTLARMLRQRAGEMPLSSAIALANLDINDWIDPDYCYAAGLAHDIGHPPFGHAGEASLQFLHLPKRSLSLNEERSFEGNAQSMRIVASLSFRKPQYAGLNLTFRTLAAIAKYPWLRGQHPTSVSKLSRKWSFYAEEKGILQQLERRGFIKTLKHKAPGSTLQAPATVVSAVYRWPEAQIMDWSDDISYAVHDMEDFFRAGLIPLHRIAGSLKRARSDGLFKNSAAWASSDMSFAEDDEEVRSALKYAREKMLSQLDEDGKKIGDQTGTAFEKINELLLDRMPTNKFDGSKLSHISLQSFASTAITFLSGSAEVEVYQVGSQSRIGVRIDPAARLVAEFFKAICQYFVINTSTLSTMQHGQALSISRLAEGLLEMSDVWLESDTDASRRTLPIRLSEYIKLSAQSTGNNAASKRNVAVAVVDFICGLRDSQAAGLESRLSGTSSLTMPPSGWLEI